MSTTRLGKSEAREQFLPLVKALSGSNGAVEITDHGKSVAVLMSYKMYQALLAKGKTTGAAKLSLAGSLTEIADVEEGSREISQAAVKAIKRNLKAL
jgi:prevent-host-death family protein